MSLVGKLVRFGPHFGIIIRENGNYCWGKDFTGRFKEPFYFIARQNFENDVIGAESIYIIEDNQQITYAWDANYEYSWHPRSSTQSVRSLK